jgi:hypothetical protein
LASALGAALFLSLAGSAHADPVNFTWSPANASTPLAGGNIVNANNFNVADFASVSVNTTTGTFTEVGALNITQFLNGGTTIASSGLNSPPNSTYSLYLTFSAAGTISGIPSAPGGTTGGTFTSLNYQLVGSTSGSPTFTVGNGSVTIGNAGTTETLAFGSLIPGTGFVTLINTGGPGVLSPVANADLSVTECTAPGQGGVCTSNESGFFVSPLQGLSLAIGNFSATSSVTTLVSGSPTSFVNIVGGGGNVTFDTPEPATLAMFGAGLLALGAGLRRRRRSRG